MIYHCSLVLRYTQLFVPHWDSVGFAISQFGLSQIQHCTVGQMAERATQYRKVFYPSQPCYKSPSFHQNTSPLWLTPSFFKMHAWHHFWNLIDLPVAAFVDSALVCWQKASDIIKTVKTSRVMSFILIISTLKINNI